MASKQHIKSYIYSLFQTKSFCICSWPFIKIFVVSFFWILFFKAVEPTFVPLRVWVWSQTDTG